MTRLRALLCALCLVVLAAFFVVYAFETASTPQKPGEQKLHAKLRVVEDAHYSKSKIISDFISSAFSKNPWPYPQQPYQEAPGLSLETAFPWFYEFIVRERGQPDVTGLVKPPQNKITVAFEWPIFTKEHPIQIEGRPYCKAGIDCRCLVQNVETFDSLTSEETEELVQHIQSELKTIESATGLEAEFRKICHDKEQTEDYAKIRIVPIFANRQYNFFKIHKHTGRIRETGWSAAGRELELQGAINFTSDRRAQVDGFILPDAQNSIGLSVCKIMPNVGLPLIKLLVSECLMRSLGFAELVENKNSILSAWNAAYEDTSKVSYMDGDVALRKEVLWWTTTQKHSPIAGAFPKKPAGISEYDQILLKIMTCPELKAGMKKEEVRDLLHSGICMNE